MPDFSISATFSATKCHFFIFKLFASLYIKCYSITACYINEILLANNSGIVKWMSFWAILLCSAKQYCTEQNQKEGQMTSKKYRKSCKSRRRRGGWLACGPLGRGGRRASRQTCNLPISEMAGQYTTHEARLFMRKHSKCEETALLFKLNITYTVFNF